MSRNLYTFAVVSPAMLISEQIARGEDVYSLERAVQDAVGESRPLVAFYRVLLDGWNCTHEVLRELLASCLPAGPVLLRQLVDRGIAVLAPDVIRNTTWPGALPGNDNLGEYALRAFWAALGAASQFAVATNGELLILWRTVGPSYDDGEFACQ